MATAATTESNDATGTNATYDPINGFFRTFGEMVYRIIAATPIGDAGRGFLIPIPGTRRGVFTKCAEEPVNVA